MTRATAPLAPLAAADAGSVATREAYGKALLELGESRPDVVVLDADLSGSTKTKAFGQRWPERFFNIGVAEANMMGTAAGLAAMGKTVFASSFAMFAAGKAWEQLRQSVCVTNLNVKVCATHAGLTVGEDGKSHQMLEDITLMRVLPNMKVIVPADGVEARQAVIAAANTPGPVYVRLSRASTPIVLGSDYQFEVGRGALLREGDDVALAACGVEVAQALIAAELLAKEGISARVMNLATIDPLDEDMVEAAARECGAIVTAEEHQVHGGLGEAVASTVARKAPCHVTMMGMQGEFGQSAPADALISHYGLDGEAIATAARELISRK